jgi:hypothetical protein
MSKPRRRFSALRPLPSGFDTSAHEPGAALEYEIAREKAASLGRLGRRLEAALEALSAFDAAPSARRSSRKPACCCGVSSCSAKPAGCATAHA